MNVERDDAPELIRQEPSPTGDPRWDALIAGVVEDLAFRTGTRIPDWVRAPERTLTTWWFATDFSGLHPIAFVETPAAIAGHGVFIRRVPRERVMANAALGRDDLLDLLDRVAAEAERRSVHLEMFIVGGGAMALAYNTRRTTGDLDAVFEPKQIAYEIAARVASEVEHLDLSPDWLNDAVKAFLPGDDPNAVVFYERAGLAIRVAERLPQ